MNKYLEEHLFMQAFLSRIFEERYLHIFRRIRHKEMEEVREMGATTETVPRTGRSIRGEKGVGIIVLTNFSVVDRLQKHVPYRTKQDRSVRCTAVFERRHRSVCEPENVRRSGKSCEQADTRPGGCISCTVVVKGTAVICGDNQQKGKSWEKGSSQTPIKGNTESRIPSSFLAGTEKSISFVVSIGGESTCKRGKGYAGTLNPFHDTW